MNFISSSRFLLHLHIHIRLSFRFFFSRCSSVSDVFLMVVRSMRNEASKQGVLPKKRLIGVQCKRRYPKLVVSAVGYCSYYGKKFDPEPGRCRRTDGKKWRCSKDAYPDSKYCERHMHRGRNRSRKPVESQTASHSQSLSTAVSRVTTPVSSTGSGNRSYQNLGSGSFQNAHLYPTSNSGSFDFGSNGSKLQVHDSPFGINNSFRYDQGLTINVDDIKYSAGASSADSTWRLVPTQISPTSLIESRNDSYLQTKSPQLTMVNAFEPVVDTAPGSKASQQQCLFGSKIESPVEVKQEHMMRPFFDEWPEPREPWSGLDVAGAKNSFSTTQLSISSACEFPARNDCPSKDD